MLYCEYHILQVIAFQFYFLLHMRLGGTVNQQASLQFVCVTMRQHCGLA